MDNNVDQITRQTTPEEYEILALIASTAFHGRSRAWCLAKGEAHINEILELWDPVREVRQNDLEFALMDRFDEIIEPNSGR